MMSFDWWVVLFIRLRWINDWGSSSACTQVLWCVFSAAGLDRLTHRRWVHVSAAVDLNVEIKQMFIVRISMNTIHSSIILPVSLGSPAHMANAGNTPAYPVHHSAHTASTLTLSTNTFGLKEKPRENWHWDLRSTCCEVHTQSTLFKVKCLIVMNMCWSLNVTFTAVYISHAHEPRCTVNIILFSRCKDDVR